ncbi:Sphingosine N-acyltransferase lag1 [Marasmius tenuissimus]|uniref:Sphingosine N-acyltransferase lag1 n=2 Tax=Marasmius tenuissimus TaxID=585030 RepID=A0ABR3AAU8_9AGAR|nr:Sphingosine N-acyltransferase lag1 [Marasmius tenuissimus]
MTSFNASEWLHPHLLPFFTLSYPTDPPKNPDSFPNSHYYGTGLKDLCMIVTIIAVFAILRDVFRLCVFEPFARWKLYRDLRHKNSSHKMNGNGKANGNGYQNGNGHAVNPTKKERRKIQHSVLRFAEQGWSMVYYPLQWAFGLYVNTELPTRLFDPTYLWINYPHATLAGPVKLYYLTQTAFYTHQILILNAEAPRKDHYQMMTHHVITVFLMSGSYYYNFTRVGCLIMVLMDWCDIFLPMAKMLRYLSLPAIYSDATFGLFVVSWFVTRHVLFVIPIYSAIFDVPRLLEFDWIPETGYYLSKGSHYIFILCLLAIEVMQILWFVMMVRIAWRVLTSGEAASDDRSEDEDDGTTTGTDEKED